MRDVNFQRRVDMIKAGAADDFQTVNKLLAEDDGFFAFAAYLRAMAQIDLGKVEKSLALPNLDRQSRGFRNMMSGAVQYAAYNGEKELVELLLKNVPAPSEIAQDGLKNLFNSLVSNERTTDASPEVAALLVSYGANITTAAAEAETRISAEQNVLTASSTKLASFKKGLC